MADEKRERHTENPEPGAQASAEMAAIAATIGSLSNDDIREAVDNDGFCENIRSLAMTVLRLTRE